jgi:hypothetical protein
MGVLASVMVEKFDLLSDTAAQRALLEGVKELNVRETLGWTNLKLSNTGWTNDADVFAAIETKLGSSYVWIDGPNASGGKLAFRAESVALSRTQSTTSSMGSWK